MKPPYRIKPPVKKGGQQFEGNPLEQGQVVDREATRKKMSKLLHAERFVQTYIIKRKKADNDEL
jgi:hypothetical protein